MSRHVTAYATALLLAVSATATTGASAAPSAVPLSVLAAVVTPVTSFGDPLEVRITVAYDAATVDGRSVDVSPGFSPYTQLAPPTIARSSSGGTGRVVLSYRLQCLTDGCLPTGAARVMRFPAIAVAATAEGRTIHATGTWPTFRVESRLRPADLTGPAHFQHAETMPAATYGVPGSVDVALAVVATVLLLGGAALVVLELVGIARRHRAVDRRTPLERALTHVRQAARRASPADRRKALDNLARVLEREGRATVAEPIADTAWRRESPTPEALIGVVEELGSAKEVAR